MLHVSDASVSAACICSVSESGPVGCDRPCVGLFLTMGFALHVLNSTENMTQRRNERFFTEISTRVLPGKESLY